MNRLISILFVAIIATTNVFGMSMSKIRSHARFLSDRMAYELDLTVAQYEYCYEINYDFIYNVNTVMNDVVYGYTDAIDRYYDFLDMRNDDMRYVLNSAQYLRFRESDYFYSPIYSNGLSWNFRIYTIYSNTSFFYYDCPVIYKTYAGGHSRHHYSTGYYVNRIDHGPVGPAPRVELPRRDSPEFMRTRKHDFGVNLRERNSPVYNNYSNGNQRNRTMDQRYRDDSGNHNSPSINNPVAPSHRPDARPDGRQDMRPDARPDTRPDAPRHDAHQNYGGVNKSAVVEENSTPQSSSTPSPTVNPSRRVSNTSNVNTDSNRSSSTPSTSTTPSTPSRSDSPRTSSHRR